MARGKVEVYTLKLFKGTKRTENQSIVDVYEDKGSILVEIFEADNSNEVQNSEYFDDVRRSFSGYIGVIRRFKLPEGKYTLSNEKGTYNVDKAHVVGNRTFLKLSIIEGY